MSVVEQVREYWNRRPCKVVVFSLDAKTIVSLARKTSGMAYDGSCNA